MSNKTMKGLLKGLRYISKVFDDEQEQPEMQIGYPTDVKHVDHIGWDGPDNNNRPTWKNDFKPNPEDDSSPRHNDQDRDGARETKGKIDTSKLSVAVPHKDGISSLALSPSQWVTDGTKKSRTRRSTQNSSLDSSPKQNKSATGGHRPSRRSQGSAQGTDPNSQDLNPPGTTKKVRRRKKVSSEAEGGSTKSTKSKEKNLSIDEADPQLDVIELAATQG